MQCPCGLIEPSTILHVPGAIGFRAGHELEAVVAVLARRGADVDVLHGRGIELLCAGTASVVGDHPDDDGAGHEIEPAHERGAPAASIDGRAHATTTVPLMSSWPEPQKTSQRKVKVPVLSGVKLQRRDLARHDVGAHA